MNREKLTLTVDMGLVGHRNSKCPFRVELDAKPLAKLMSDASKAYRVYELMLIARPGDVWRYVEVVPSELPPTVVRLLERARESAAKRYRTEAPWPKDRIPLFEFDSLFGWAGDDTEPEDDAWLSQRESRRFYLYARQLLEMARGSQVRLNSKDPLIRGELKRIQAGVHKFDCLAREDAIRSSRAHPPVRARNKQAFYERLEELLSDPLLVSVAYRGGSGDYKILKMLCSEQRCRSDRTGKQPYLALAISALADKRVNVDAWGADIRFFDEGIGPGNLFIEEWVVDEKFKDLLEKRRRLSPGLCILARGSTVELDGYSREDGDGWTIFRRIAPTTRRRELEEVNMWASREAMLTFESEAGGTVFASDKTLMIVGEGVSDEVRETLGEVVAEWEKMGEAPVTIVSGNPQPFNRRLCKSVLYTQAATLEASPAAAGEWFAKVLKERRPWIDVAILLDVPNALRSELNIALSAQVKPWSPWIVSGGESRVDRSDVALDHNLASAIQSARSKALAGRPVALYRRED